MTWQCVAKSSGAVGFWCLLGVTVACGAKSSSNACEPGALRCSCLSNHACDNGLVCISDVCVANAGATSTNTNQVTPSTGGASPSQPASQAGSTAIPTSVAQGGTAATHALSGGSSGGVNGGLTPIGGSAGSVVGGSVPDIGSTSGGTITTPNGGATSTIASTVPDACQTALKTLDSTGNGQCSYAAVAPNNVLILLDRSGSMTSVPAGDTQTKWDGAKSVLGALRPNDDRIRYGLMLFPTPTDPTTMTGCEFGPDETAIVVPVGPAQVTVAQINASLAASAPVGGTPTAAALAAAERYFTSGAGASLKGAKYVLLITDGGPNCNEAIDCGPDTCTANLDRTSACGTGIPNCCDPAIGVAGRISLRAMCLDDASVRDQINSLRAHAIKTFVVGIPGTEAYAKYLNDFAVVGGMPVEDPTSVTKYFAATSAASLGATIAQITDVLTRSCSVALEAAPRDRSNLNLLLDCTVLPNKSVDTQNWHYNDNPAAPAIVIDGQACQRIQSAGVGRADVVVGCPPAAVL